MRNLDDTLQMGETITTDVWYNIRIKAIISSDRFVGYLGETADGDPEEQWDVTDSSVSGVSTNNFALGTWNTQSEFDNWRIRKYAAMEPVAEVVKHYTKPATNLPFTPTTQTTSFEYDDYNKLTEITNPDSTTETLSYDDNGQLVKSEKSTGETTGYEWNDHGMLVKVILPTGEPVEYEYDGNQRLISRKSSDGVDNFVQSGWDIITKTDDLGKRTYYTGKSAVVDEDNQTYFHYNHRGDTVLVTDANGEILHNLSYEAYGKPTNSEGIPVNNLSIKNIPNLFVGASGIRYDTRTDLHYMRFRWFSQDQMRFISPDLLIDLNRYAYVSGNPIGFIDSFGLEESAIGPTGTIIWRDIKDKNGKIIHTVKYHLPKFNYHKDKYKMEGRDILGKKLSDIVKGVLDTYYDDLVEAGETTNLRNRKGIDVVMCHTWKDKFAKPGKGEQCLYSEVLTTILKPRIENEINLSRDLAASQIRVTNIEAFVKTIPKHGYAYIHVVFSNGREIWLLTESNASRTFINEGSINYQTYPVRPPDVFIPIKKNKS